jgi:hypothetical protein
MHWKLFWQPNEACFLKWCFFNKGLNVNNAHFLKILNWMNDLFNIQFPKNIIFIEKQDFQKHIPSGKWLDCQKHVQKWVQGYTLLLLKNFINFNFIYINHFFESFFLYSISFNIKYIWWSTITAPFYIRSS